MDRRDGSRGNPILAVELACGSQSTRRVLSPECAREAAKFTAVVVFPTPPFWLATAITLPKNPPVPRDGAQSLMNLGQKNPPCQGNVSRETILTVSKRLVE